MKPYVTAILIASVFSTASMAIEYEYHLETVPMVYFKIPLGLHGRNLRDQSHIGFAVNYRTNDGYTNQYLTPLLDISYSGNHQAMMHIHGIKVFNFMDRLYQDECTGEECGGSAGVGLVLGAVVVGGYIALKKLDDDLREYSEDFNNYINDSFR